MSKFENRISFPVSTEIQAFVENVCTRGGYTFESFFEHLIQLYKNSLKETLSVPKEKMQFPHTQRSARVKLENKESK